MDEAKHRATLATEALLLEALAAYRALRDAEDGGAPLEEIYRLGLRAEPLMRAAIDLRLLVIASMRGRIH